MTQRRASRNEIIGIADDGLALQIDGRESVAPWSAILDVSAVMAVVDRTSDRRMPVFVLGIMVDGHKRVFLIGESEPLWEPLASTLSDFLGGIPPQEIWSAKLAGSGEASLYNRAGMQ